MIRHLKQNQMLYDNLLDREKEIERMEEILGDIDLDVVDYVADPTKQLDKGVNYHKVILKI